MSINDRNYIVGATVKLVVGITDPFDRSPVDPPGGVTLVGLILAGTNMTLPGDVTFDKITPGEYRLSLQTTGFAPGSYIWRAAATDTNGDVALSEDNFVLRAAA